MSPGASFRTTHWSLVLAAGDRTSPDSREALSTLCETYWYPLYAFARRRGLDAADAQDLTQAFFTRVLEKESLRHAAPEKGRFRSFLLTSFKNFISDERALEKERDLRYQHASDVKVDVESIGDAGPKAAPPARGAPPPASPGGTRVVEIKRPLGVVLVAVYVGLILPLLLPILLRVGFLSFGSPMLMSPRMAWQSWIIPGLTQSTNYLHARPFLAWCLAFACIAAGVGLLRLRRWSRTWAIVISLIGAFLFFPGGAIPAVLVLVYLYRHDVKRIFELGEGPAELSEEEAARLEPLMR